MTSFFQVSRQIGIDAGHRVMNHGSKCRHLHGHRYTIEAVCLAEQLTNSGEQTGMVLDFGFLKDEMMTVIDAPCDHGFLVQIDDVELLALFSPEGRDAATWIAGLRRVVERDGFCLTMDTRLSTKLYVLPDSPTAEQLSRHWFHRLKPAVALRSNGLARLVEVVVWETPHCRASYREP